MESIGSPETEFQSELMISDPLAKLDDRGLEWLSRPDSWRHCQTAVGLIYYTLASLVD